MMRLNGFVAPIAVLIGMIVISQPAEAERLEVGLAVSPVVVLDSGYDAFSRDDVPAFRGGITLRSEVTRLAQFGLVPFVGYRFAADRGEPYSIIKTNLFIQDFFGGLRVRRELIPWLGVMLDVFGGVMFTSLKGSLTSSDESFYMGSEQRYEDSKLTWSAGALAGLEFQISKSWLKSRGIRRFGFSGDLSGGYVRRGETAFEPKLDTGQENVIQSETLPWGSLDLSGWTVELGISARFF